MTLINGSKKQERMEITSECILRTVNYERKWTNSFSDYLNFFFLTQRHAVMLVISDKNQPEKLYWNFTQIYRIEFTKLSKNFYPCAVLRRTNPARVGKNPKRAQHTHNRAHVDKIRIEICLVMPSLLRTRQKKFTMKGNYDYHLGEYREKMSLLRTFTE